MLHVADLHDLKEGVVTTVRAGGREVILVRWNSGVYSLRNICPHQSASFSAGWARPSIVRCLPDAPAETSTSARQWDLDVDENQPVVRCPWHKWEFRLSDGICVTDSRFRVRAYTTTVEDGKVFLDMAV